MRVQLTECDFGDLTVNHGAMQWPDRCLRPSWQVRDRQRLQREARLLARQPSREGHMPRFQPVGTVKYGLLPTPLRGRTPYQIKPAADLRGVSSAEYRFASPRSPYALRFL